MTCPTSCTVRAEFLSSVLTRITPWLSPAIDRMALAGSGAPWAPGLNTKSDFKAYLRQLSVQRWWAQLLIHAGTCGWPLSWPQVKKHMGRSSQVSAHETETRSGRHHMKRQTLRWKYGSFICTYSHWNTEIQQSLSHSLFTYRDLLHQLRSACAGKTGWCLSDLCEPS